MNKNITTHSKYIALSGMDGCGKTTQLDLLKYYLSFKHPLHVTAEPGGTSLAREIRALLKDTEYNDMPDSTEALLFTAARTSNAVAVVKALNAGKVVLSDRCYLDGMAYQGAGKGDMGIQKLLADNFVLDRPGLIIYLDATPEVRADRMTKRGDSADRMDSYEVGFNDRAAQYFKSSNKVTIVNANLDAAELHQIISRIVDNYLQES